MEMIDEEKMKKFDELHQNTLDAMKAAEDARNEFFNFIKTLNGTKFKSAYGPNYIDKKCQIAGVYFPRFKAFAGFIAYKCLNRRH